MDDLIKKFEIIKDSKDFEIINEFLIIIGKNPQKDYINIVDFFLDNYDPEIFENIKLNLIYILGEIGTLINLDNKYIDFLIKQYFISDQWIRSDIINSISKIGKKTKLSEKVLEIIQYALLEEYIPIVINGMKSLLYFETIPDKMFRNIFMTLKIKDTILNSQTSIVIKKFIPDGKILYEKLDYLENYKVFDKRKIRSLLICYFDSIIKIKNLELFDNLIKNSKWDNQYKEKFLNEIDVYEKILLKRI